MLYWFAIWSGRLATLRVLANIRLLLSRLGVRLNPYEDNPPVLRAGAVGVTCESPLPVAAGGKLTAQTLSLLGPNLIWSILT